MARRRKNKRSDIQFKLFVALSLLIAGSVAGISMSFTKGFNATVFLVTFFITLVILAILSIIFSLPSVKGKLGERKVSKRLNKLANKYGGIVIDNVMIPDESGTKSSQIDHIYASNYGIFVVETKNYAGRIYGSDEQQNWTQVLAYGNAKNKLYNPVKQNQTHIYRLKNALGIRDNFVSVIVFVNANIQYIESDYVYSFRDLKHLIDKDSKTTISDVELSKIANTLLEYKENPFKTNKEHVKEIKQMKKDISHNICPRCGGQLVLRKSKDGRTFYGCSNYPNCKFTKKS